VSEEIIAKAIKKYEIPRHKLVILTKCHGVVGEDPSIRGFFYPQEIKKSKDYVNQSGIYSFPSPRSLSVRLIKISKTGLSRQAIFSAVEASLRRLDTPYIDLLQIHRFDASTPIEETMEALHDLVKSGKVRYIGASSMWATQFARMQFVAEKHGFTKFISMQNHYNLLYREEEREMNRFCNDTGVGLIPVGTHLGIFCTKLWGLTTVSGHRFAEVTLLVLTKHWDQLFAASQKLRRDSATRISRPSDEYKNWRSRRAGRCHRSH
jgi:aryl-alcohol dehydrogenase-like predicted oxidoreductase